MTEDERIRLIGHVIAQSDGIALIGVCVDDDGTERASRYIEKITSRYPAKLVDQHPGVPAKGIRLLRFRRALS